MGKKEDEFLCPSCRYERDAECLSAYDTAVCYSCGTDFAMAASVPAPEPMIPARISQALDDTSEALATILGNAQRIPDPRMDGATDVYAVPLDDIEAIVAVLLRTKTALSLPGDGEIVRSIPPEEGEGKEKDAQP